MIKWMPKSLHQFWRNSTTFWCLNVTYTNVLSFVSVDRTQVKMLKLSLGIYIRFLNIVILKIGMINQRQNSARNFRSWTFWKTSAYSRFEAWWSNWESKTVKSQIKDKSLFQKYVEEVSRRGRCPPRNARHPRTNYSTDQLQSLSRCSKSNLRHNKDKCFAKGEQCCRYHVTTTLQFTSAEFLLFEEKYHFPQFQAHTILSLMEQQKVLWKSRRRYWERAISFLLWCQTEQHPLKLSGGAQQRWSWEEKSVPYYMYLPCQKHSILPGQNRMTFVFVMQSTRIARRTHMTVTWILTHWQRWKRETKWGWKLIIGEIMVYDWDSSPMWLWKSLVRGWNAEGGLPQKQETLATYQWC